MSKPTLNRSDWKLVGHFGVDAGLCWIGDPCYILHKQPGELPESVGKDWGEFCDKLDHSGPTLQSFNYALGHEGLGVCVSTGYGDGSYPVYAFISDEGDWGNRVGAIFIDFLGIFADEDEEDDEPEECSECGDELDDAGICQNSDCPECPDYENECLGCNGELVDGECINPDCDESPEYEPEN